jgi:hypothetical protein
MSNIEFAKSYNAAAAIAASTIVKFGSNDYDVIPAAASTDLLIGVSRSDVAAASGEPVDIIHEGIAHLKLGGTVTRGAKITSDASGYGIAAAPAAGVNAQIIGFALASGVSGDVIPLFIAFSVMQG